MALATLAPWLASFSTGRDHLWFDVETDPETDEEDEKTIVSAEPEPSTSAIHPSALEDLQERVKQHKANVEFIAHSRTDVVDLLNEVERLRNEVERLRGVVAVYRVAPGS